MNRDRSEHWPTIMIKFQETNGRDREKVKLIRISFHNSNAFVQKIKSFIVEIENRAISGRRIEKSIFIFLHVKLFEMYAERGSMTIVDMARKKEKLLSSLLVFMVSKVAHNVQYINIFLWWLNKLLSIRRNGNFSFLLLNDENCPIY